MYTIRYRPDLNLLDIEWAGLFTPDDMVRYADDCRACWKEAQFQPGYLLRIILSDNQALPQETLTILSDAFTDFPSAGRIAMVTQSAIARMQINRVMLVPHMRIFPTPEAALEWLLS